ncbi:thioredoxin family protein [Silvibacterium acidisoli]|uniref:thioredoxin family protein n=1 Tax=Acidobacteriaceae bacterium ZG23-2 TaxID=2883246 RepID=UPI00406BF39A
MIQKLRLAACALFIAAFASAAMAQGRIIYSDTADAHADITKALHEAARTHKRVILDFGGNWCGDCQVLDIYFHQEPNLSILDKSFILVHVDIGHMDKNTDVAEKYEIPLHKGVPALAVLDRQGKLLYSQKAGEFEAMRRMDPASVTNFLNQWKAKG